MVIGVDAGCLGILDNRLKAGVYYVAFHLLRELSRLDKKNKYILYSFYPIPKEVMQEFSPAWENKVLLSKGWLYFSLPLQFLKQKPDVFLALSQAMPWYHPCKTIGFIHGLDFFPKFHIHKNNLKKLRKHAQFLITHADTLVTTSRFLRTALHNQYHAKNVHVSHLGVDKVFFKKMKLYHSNKPYFLFVGTLKPSKNIPAILEAFAIFLKKTKHPYDLVCIGSDFWLDTTFSAIIERLSLTKNVVFISSQPQDSLLPYYAGATAFVSPSLYEGFGLPYLEAMAAGCPVIGSTVGAIPEIIGDAGIVVNPNDYQAIADAMIEMTEDKTFADELRKRGIERAKQFTWEKFASSVYNLYKV